jgi:hypothetical protein
MVGEQYPTRSSTPPAVRDEDLVSAELVELDRSACLRLLAGADIGRVVFTEAALPAAQPVSYVLVGEEIVFRTANGSKLAAATRHAVVAFEVDEIDAASRSGWSVLGVGHAYEVTEPRRLADLALSNLVAWVPGPLPHTIAIPLQHLTGRWLPGRSASRAGGPSEGLEATV